jgi:hypothetical protein
MNNSLDRALRLLDDGLSVIPLGSGKVPYIGWKPYQTKQMSKKDLERHSSNSLFSGYAICCGYRNIECIDVDLKVITSLSDQKAFWNEFIQLLKDHIDDFDQKFVIYKTVNAGYHIIYRCEQIAGNQKLATLKGSKRAIIETRGIGGYICVYDNQISPLGYSDIKEISIEDRETLMGLCAYYNYVEEKDIDLKPKQTESPEITTWDDFNSRKTSLDVLGSDFSVVRDLQDKIIIKRFGAESPHSGYIFKQSGLMYLFSTATIYPHEKALSPFSIYAYKHHNGDHSAAAKDLYQQGYGSRFAKKPEIISQKQELIQEHGVFPIDVFPESIQNYITLSAKTLNYSIDYMGCAMLWLISLIVGNSFKIQVKSGWWESTNIWISLIGKAGIGKTPSLNAVLFPLKRKNAFEIREYNKALKKYIEYEKLSKEEKATTEKQFEPKRKQFIVNDITLEALVELHEENKNSVGVHKDELAGWVKDMNKYRAGSDLEFWLSSWSNETVSLNRKTSKSSFIESPVIPVIGGVQPNVFSKIATDDNKDNGFIDRLLPCYPDLDIEEYNKAELHEDVLEWYNAYIDAFHLGMKSLIKLDHEQDIVPNIVHWTKEAEDEWIRIFNHITAIQNNPDENEYTKSMLAKQKTYVPRFALLLNCLACFDNEIEFSKVNKESVLGAEKLFKYFHYMAKKIKINSLESNAIHKILKAYDNLDIVAKIRKVNELIPDFRKTELAEILNVSRQTIYNAIKNDTNANTKK